MQSRRLVILGGGIKGSAVAALASLAGYEVVLVERRAIAAGATSTNHGRLHAGTASWRNDTVDLMRHRAAGARLLIDVLGLAEAEAPALYLFQSGDEGRKFAEKAAAGGIPVRCVADSRGASDWPPAGHSAVGYEVQEYGFDPSETAARFVGVALARGGSLRTAAALGIKPAGSGLVVHLETGERIACDLVVNALSAWTGEVEVPASYPTAAIDWFRWSLMCAPQAPFPPLDRVVVWQPEGKAAVSVVPHGDWITFDSHDTRVEAVASPLLEEDWRRADPHSAEDMELLGKIAAGLAPAAARDVSLFYRLTGIHPRRRNCPPGSRNEVMAADGRYFLCFGGQASTALLDACQAMDALAAAGGAATLPPESRAAALKDAYQTALAAPARPMRWRLSP